MSREDMAQEMIEKLKGQGTSFLTEVAVPGVKPNAVRDDEIDTYAKDRSR